MTTRRAFLAGLGASAAALGWAGVGLAAAPTDRRLIVLQLRGGMDGLAAIVPHGDPDYATARGNLALPRESVLDLDGFYGLHPSLSALLPMWTAGELLAVHAVALPYRGRSHFEGQNLLETGVDTPYAVGDGWLGRALEALSPAEGVAIGPQLPLVLRGSPRATSVDPLGSDETSDEFLDLVARMYEGDPMLGPALMEGRGSLEMVRAASEGAPTKARKRDDYSALAGTVAEILAKEDGPRIAVASLSGWDTHQGEGTTDGTLARLLGQVGAGIQKTKESLGSVWERTAMLVVTEFGRTVQGNGTSGADHGTACVALLVGGAVKGQRVVAKWPGLAERFQHEGRDLAPTTDLRSVYKAVLRDHLGIADAVIEDRVIPSSSAAPLLEGLFRA